MEEYNVSHIEPGGDAYPLCLRLIRKWNPPFKGYESCFLFVDKEGYAIQANAKRSEQEAVENRLQLGSCYRVTDYGCGDADPYSNILTHACNMVLGRTSVFTPIPDNNDLPTEFYDIATRQRMENACISGNKLIDYIGILLDVQHKETNENKPYVTLILKDASSQILRINVWEEIATSLQRFNFPLIEAATQPRIIALTALKARIYNGRPNLTSSTATYIYLNPATPEKQQLIHLYDHPDTPPLLQSTHFIQTSPQTPETISQLISKPISELKQRRFIVTGIISNILNKQWCMAACRLCTLPVVESREKWFCPKDNTVTDVIFSYKIQATISDSTGSMDAVIYDDPLAELLGMSCRSIMESNPGIDRKHTPDFLAAVAHKPVKMHITVFKGENTRNCRCMIERIVYMPNFAPHTPAKPTQFNAPLQIKEGKANQKRQLIEELDVNTRKKGKAVVGDDIEDQSIEILHEQSVNVTASAEVTTKNDNSVTKDQ